MVIKYVLKINSHGQQEEMWNSRAETESEGSTVPASKTQIWGDSELVPLPLTSQPISLKSTLILSFSFFSVLQVDFCKELHSFPLHFLVMANPSV